MSRQQANIEQISVVAERLGDILSDVVFVGGTVTGFMMTDTTSHVDFRASRSMLQQLFSARLVNTIGYLEVLHSGIRAK